MYGYSKWITGNDGGKFYPFLNIELFLEEIHWNTDHLSQDV